MWTLESTRIFTQTFDGSSNQIIARLEPFDGGTIHHVYGYEDPIYQLNGFIVGSGDLNTLVGYSQDGNTHTLTDYDSSDYTVYLKKIAHKRMPTICQTFYVDATHLTTDTVYVVDLELYIE